MSHDSSMSCRLMGSLVDILDASCDGRGGRQGRAYRKLARTRQRSTANDAPFLIRAGGKSDSDLQAKRGGA